MQPSSDFRLGKADQLPEEVPATLHRCGQVLMLRYVGLKEGLKRECATVTSFRKKKLAKKEVEKIEISIAGCEAKECLH